MFKSKNLKKIIISKSKKCSKHSFKKVKCDIKHQIKPSHKTYLWDVSLETVDFACSVVLLEEFDDLLHVALQIICEGFLVGESGFDESVVKDNVDARFCPLIGSFVKLLGRGVGAFENNLPLLAGLVLEEETKLSNVSLTISG